MKWIQKIKNLFRRKSSRVGAINVYFLDKDAGKVFCQHIYGITIYKDRKRMMDYLHRTVMTTMVQRIKLLDYEEVNK
tara:strand:+ start:495 stop:725 length:231 start_codon:yes stop_codon:yes gene_type:complete